MNLGDICSSEYLLADLEEGLEQAVKKLSGQGYSVRTGG